MTERGRVVVLANPTAGRGRAGRLIGKVDRILREMAVDHSILVSESATHLERLASEAARGGASVVAALGGDGTAGICANGLMGTEAALAVIPAGTGDDFAAAIGAKKVDTAIRLLGKPQVKRIDVSRITTGSVERYSVNVAGAGFDSEVNETANAMRLRLGSTGTYVAAVLKTLSHFTPAKFAIQIDTDSMQVAAMLVVVGNGTSYGGGMKVLPEASMTDGTLDVCIVTAMGRWGFLRAFPRVFRGTHTDHPNVVMSRGRTVRVEADRRLDVYADGERVGPLPAVFEVVPEALRVVVGPDAKAIG